MTHVGTVTLLFTDLVNSTDLLKRMGDEEAQRIFRTHHKLLSDAVSAHGGHEVKWLGDGLMVAFPSAADAVRCAIAMQQSARRPVAGVRLGIRAGLHVGEALREEADYFGTAVVIARRLCETASAGQILASAMVSGLLAGRQSFNFSDHGTVELKGLGSFAASEVVYERDDPSILLQHTPFVGRSAELAKLEKRLADARIGHGGLVMLVGEPGIGKSRTIEEFAERARKEGALVLWGRCYEGEWAPPFGPFAEALTQHIKFAEPEELRRDLSFGAPALSRLVPALRERITDIAEPAALQPDEERFRLLDAVSQFLIALSARKPVVLVLDDLHWADRGTIGMLRHLARFVAQSQILVVGAYRDVELDRQHPLADALGALRREAGYERIALRGLDTAEIAQLLETIGEQDVPDALVKAISAETEGNPFFIREVMLHLVEEGKISREQGRWAALSIEDMGIPEGIRQLIRRRLSRLSADANSLLAVASGFSGVFRFDIAESVAGLDDAAALRAIDEVLAAQLIRPSAEAESYDFTHALVRHALYAEMNPSRLSRLHRRIAEAMQRVWGDRASDHAAEVAYQYWRSAALPGAGRGADYAVIAANRAESAYAHDEVVSLLRIALELLPPDDPRRPRLLGRLGISLSWTLEFEEALKTTCEAGTLIAEAEGEHSVADYFAEAARAAMIAGAEALSVGVLASQGLRYMGNRRDPTWATLMSIDLSRREVEDRHQHPGIPTDSPERRELSQVVESLSAEQREKIGLEHLIRPNSRSQILSSWNDSPRLLEMAGDFRRSIPLNEARAAQREQQRALASAATHWAFAARCHNSLGDFARAHEVLRRARSLARRVGLGANVLFWLANAEWEIGIATGEGWERRVASNEAFLAQPPSEYASAHATVRAAFARAYAFVGREREALALMPSLLSDVESARFWASDYPILACETADTLWLLGRVEHVETIERNLREKVLAPDFRCHMRDGRLSLARLCGLQGRYDEAVKWFAEARTVLDEQGARPLRAIADFDEALMYLRRGGEGDKERARPRLDAAMAQFKLIGMTGWIRRAEDLALGAN